MSDELPPALVLGSDDTKAEMPYDGLLDGYMKLSDFAKSMGVHERTAYRWTQTRNGLPSVKIGATRLVKIETARAWIASREEKPLPDRPRRRARST